jgi:pseudouridine synthase
MKIRLNKFLSLAGVASRREGDRLITEGRVQVNKQIVNELGHKIDDETDIVYVDGKRVRPPEKQVYLILNKPSGYLVTLKDPFGRRTIRDLLPASLGRVFPVGRLDLDTQGLLLLTTDGELAYRLSHPRFRVKKAYVAKVHGAPTLEALSKLERGVYLEGKRTAPAKVVLLAQGPKSSVLRIELHEGRKREVRNMCQAVGYNVLELKRVGFAGLELKKMKPGEWRHLEPRELRKLRELVKLS